MAEITVKTVKLSAIKLNPANPRLISTKDMDRLVKSLREFPEMLNIREIVVDENLVALGGNMRTLALRKAGAKTCTVKIVSGWTEEEKRRFVISDNGSMGEWDMSLLSSLWSDLPLVDWGVKIPEAWGKEPADEEPSPMAKNFEASREPSAGEDDGEREPTPDASGKYPITFILDAAEWERWVMVKAGLKIKADKAAFLKMIGGDHA